MLRRGLTQQGLTQVLGFRDFAELHYGIQSLRVRRDSGRPE